MLKATALCLLMMTTAALGGQQTSPAPKTGGPAAAPARKSAAPPAAPDAAPQGAPTREEILQLFDLLQISKTMEIAVQAARQQSFEMAEQMVRERAPDATAEQKKQLQTMIDEAMNEALGPAAIKEMLNATIPVYQRHLTKADLKAMVGFYSSPVGKKILREQPAMVQESMQAASGIQQRIARTVLQKIDQRVEEIVGPEKEPGK
jgi:hypothetical protein